MHASYSALGKTLSVYWLAYKALGTSPKVWIVHQFYRVESFSNSLPPTLDPPLLTVLPGWQFSGTNYTGAGQTKGGNSSLKPSIFVDFLTSKGWISFFFEVVTHSLVINLCVLYWALAMSLAKDLYMDWWLQGSRLHLNTFCDVTIIVYIPEI